MGAFSVVQKIDCCRGGNLAFPLKLLPNGGYKVAFIYVKDGKAEISIKSFIALP